MCRSSPFTTTVVSRFECQKWNLCKINLHITLSSGPICIHMFLVCISICTWCLCHILFFKYNLSGVPEAHTTILRKSYTKVLFGNRTNFTFSVRYTGKSYRKSKTVLTYMIYSPSLLNLPAYSPRFTHTQDLVKKINRYVTTVITVCVIEK